MYGRFPSGHKGGLALAVALAGLALAACGAPAAVAPSAAASPVPDVARPPAESPAAAALADAPALPALLTVEPSQTPHATATAVPSPVPFTTTVALAEPLATLPRPHTFDGEASYRHVLAQDEPRPTGSEASVRLAEYIGEHLQAYDWQVEVQEFTYQGVQARNIIGSAGSGPIVIIGAHYDTRRVADADPDASKRATPVPGANDGASGVAVLLELAAAIDHDKLQYEVWLTFFDAEDNGHLDEWEWCAGSAYMAEHLTDTPYFVVVVDMVGDADQQIYRERSSNSVLVDHLWSIAAGLGHEQYFIPEYKWSMTDDHTPFLNRGIPAALLIDFDYPYWHTTEDTADKVSADSLRRVGEVLQVLLEAG